MKKNTLLVLITLLFVIKGLDAQEFSFGFKTGLNHSSTLGIPLTQDGKDVESFMWKSGLHIGVIFNYSLTDLLGVKSEILYSQEGAIYEFNGEGTQNYLLENNGSFSGTGELYELIQISNTLINMPVMFYGKFFEKLQLNGGVYVSLLVNSKGEGERKFKGVTEFGNGVNYSQDLNHNYLKSEVATSEETINIKKGSDDYFINKVEGAYDRTIFENPLYNRFDFGLTAEVSYYLKPSLLIGFRLNYGLSDLTNNNYNFKGGGYIDGSGKDSNITLQASIGFLVGS